MSDTTTQTAAEARRPMQAPRLSDEDRELLQARERRLLTWRLRAFVAQLAADGADEFTLAQALATCAAETSTRSAPEPAPAAARAPGAAVEGVR